MTNAFNLLDNMDGLCAGVALVASAVFLLNAWALGEFFISLLLLAFMGSLLGFLFYNCHPASVFLGDCGSLFIGYVMASLTLLERYVSNASSTLFPVLMPVLVLAVPIMDTATVISSACARAGRSTSGDRRHLSHRLVALGFSPRTRRAVHLPGHAVPRPGRGEPEQRHPRPEPGDPRPVPRPGRPDPDPALRGSR